MNSLKTVVLGASPNPSRYSNMAVKKLNKHGHEVIPIGLREGEIDGIEIQTERKELDNVDTVSLYVGPKNQEVYLNYIKQLNPRRVILNPGTENEELIDFLRENEIEAVEACTLVMLSANTY